MDDYTGNYTQNRLDKWREEGDRKRADHCLWNHHWCSSGFLVREGEKKKQKRKTVVCSSHCLIKENILQGIFFLATNSWKNLCDRTLQGHILVLGGRPPSLEGLGNSSHACGRGAGLPCWSRNGRLITRCCSECRGGGETALGI